MRSEVLNREIDATITHMGLTIKRDWDNRIADMYRVTIAGHEVPYFCGIGRRKLLSWLANSEERNCLKHNYHDKRKQIKHIERATSVKLPGIDDILYCLVLDAAAAEMSFEDWCSDYGYDTDSRKALHTFLDCQKMAKVLTDVGIDIEEAQEAFQDY